MAKSIIAIELDFSAITGYSLERGQIVIPKEAREIFDINPGDTLLVLGDEEQGIAVVKPY